MQGDRERCLEAGFDPGLAKPVCEAELHAVVEALTRGLPAPASPAPEIPGEDSGAYIAGLVEGFDGDETFAREVVVSFLETAPLSVDAIGSAPEAGDLARVATEAHGLKGISLTVGADDLAEACRGLQEAARRGDLAEARAGARPLHDSWTRLESSLLAFARA